MGAATTESPADEVIEVEVVDGQPTIVAGEVVRPESESAAAANRAIVAASEAALASADIPGRDEFLSLAMQARVLSMSGAAPKLVRNNPHLAFHVAMIGRDLGISPSAALEQIDVIDGRDGPQLSLSPQLLNGQIRRLGLGSIVPVVKTNARCVAVAMGPDGFYDPRCKREWPDHHELCECTIRLFLGESEFTWEQAQMAGLVGPQCEPGNHSSGCKSWTRGMSCNQGYRTYPQRMMWWRAAGFLADDIFPEASLGLYSPEALGAVVDEHGRPIDPSTVELPEGYEPKAVGTGRSSGQPAAEGDDPADPAVLEDLTIRVRALPEEQRAVLKDRWNDSNRLRGHQLSALPASAVSVAESMVKGFEVIAKRAGWDPDEARAAVEAQIAASAPADEPSSEPEGDVPDESPGEQSGSQGPSDEAAEDDESPAGEPERDHPSPDPAVAAWVREVADAAPAESIGPVMAEVKAMHHAVLNRELLALGWDPAGQHIDTRRMVLAAARLEAIMHPEACRAIRCSEDHEPDAEWCSSHTPF
jgi:hypothetical protein